MNKIRYFHLVVGLILSSLLLMACSDTSSTPNDEELFTPETTSIAASATIDVPTSTPKSTDIPLPTDTPQPATKTPLPATKTPTVQIAALVTTVQEPTSTPKSTDTPQPTDTPQSATKTPTLTTIQEPTSTPKSTDIPLPTDTPQPATKTPQPATNTPTPTAIGCTDDSAFVSDVTIPDDTEMKPSESFTKTWRLQNDGTCKWTTSYEFVFIEGEQMGGPVSVPISQDVVSDSTIDISVTFTAPTVPGTYLSRWQLQTPDGTPFGAKPYVQIMVKDPNVLSEEEQALLVNLKKELFFFLGGGGAPCDKEAPLGTDSPTIEASITPGFLNYICLWNFPDDEVATVELHAPNGRIYSDVFELKDVYQVGLGGIDLWWPVSMPTGEWYIFVKSESASDQDLVTIENPSETFSIIPASDVDPFDLSHIKWPCSLYNYEVSDQLEIQGVNYPPNKKLPIGIYAGENNIGNLIFSKVATTDSQGNFKLLTSIDSSYSIGRYYVIVVTDPNQEQYRTFRCFVVQ